MRYVFICKRLHMHPDTPLSHSVKVHKVVSHVN